MLNAYYFYLIERFLFSFHIPFLPRIIELLIFLIYNSKIPYQAVIGCGSRFGYGGMGVVIHEDCTIGKDCTICQQVTIGGGIRDIPASLR